MLSNVVTAVVHLTSSCRCRSWQTWGTTDPGMEGGRSWSRSCCTPEGLCREPIGWQKSSRRIPASSQPAKKEVAPFFFFFKKSDFHTVLPHFVWSEKGGRGQWKPISRGGMYLLVLKTKLAISGAPAHSDPFFRPLPIKERRLFSLSEGCIKKCTFSPLLSTRKNFTRKSFFV